MSKSVIGLGSVANDETGDSLRLAGAKINNNFTEIYNKIGDGETLTSDTIVLVEATQTLPNKTLTTPVLNSGTVLTSITPSSADGATLGTSALEWSDLYLADGGIIQFGDDQDVLLTHVADTGLLLNSTMALQFNDASQFINAPSATVLDINATDEIELNATAVDLNGTLDVSGDVTLQSDLELQHDGAVLKFGADDDVTVTHVADTGLLLNGTSVIQFNDASQNIGAPSNAILDINATDEIELNATLVDVNGNLDVSGTIVGAGAITGGGLMTTGGNIVIPNAGNIGSAGDTDSMSIASNGVVTFSQAPVFPDGSIPIADLDIDGATDIGAAIADADLFIVDDGAGGTNRKTTASRLKTYIDAGLPRGYLSGMGLSNETDTDHDITVGIGEVRDNANAVDIVLASAMTKRIDATWASGSDNGGLASGVSLENNTWYHVHAIVVSGSADIGFDTSVTAANLVANNSASAFRRIGAVLTDGSGNILNFIQDGDEFIFKAQITNINASAIGTARVTQVVSVPLGVRCRAILGLIGVVANSSAGVLITLTAPDVTDATPARGNLNNGGENSSDNNGTWASGTHIVLTDTSSQVAIRQDTNSSVSLNTNGYLDRRGQG
jgi:hypothetical protein